MIATLRPTLLTATTLLAAIAVAWAWLWINLTQQIGNPADLRAAGPLAYLALGPALSLLAAILCWRRPRGAGWTLTLGGIGAAAVPAVARVPDYGAPEGLWCLGVAMIALGAGWLSLARARPSA